MFFYRDRSVLIQEVGRQLTKTLGYVHAYNYKVVGDGGNGLVVRSGGCDVAKVVFADDESYSFEPNLNTEQGQKFDLLLKASTDFTPWWKVIYNREDLKAAVFCGDRFGKRTKEEALKELTSDIMDKHPRLVVFSYAGCLREDQLKTIVFCEITGNWPDYKLGKDFYDRSFVFCYL